MKRFFLLPLVVFLLPVWAANAQTSVTAPLVETLLSSQFTANAVHYADIIEKTISQGSQFAVMIDNLYRQAEMAAQNLKSFGDIESFSGLMHWYNRQLDYEKRTVEAFNNMSFSVGKKSYKLTDIEGMAYGVKKEFFDVWDDEFTEEEKREMWLTLGLTPANYAYVQVWKEKEREIVKNFLTAKPVHNEKYAGHMKRNGERQKTLADDKTLGLDDKMGEKEVLTIIAETSIANNEVLNDILMLQVEDKELRAVEEYQKRAPVDQPTVAYWKRGFEPLGKGKMR